MSKDPTFKRRPNGIAEDLGGLIGLSNTLLLCGIKGGSNLYIPERTYPDHWLYRNLGASAMQRLVEEYGGTSITLPCLIEFTRYQRIRRCASLIQRGLSMPRVAQAIGVTVRQAILDRHSAEELGILPQVLGKITRAPVTAEVTCGQPSLPGM